MTPWTCLGSEAEIRPQKPKARLPGADGTLCIPSGLCCTEGCYPVTITDDSIDRRSAEPYCQQSAQVLESSTAFGTIERGARLPSGLGRWLPCLRYGRP
jgi:hypothetical protein